MRVWAKLMKSFGQHVQIASELRDLVQDHQLPDHWIVLAYLPKHTPKIVTSPHLLSLEFTRGLELVAQLVCQIQVKWYKKEADNTKAEANPAKRIGVMIVELIRLVCDTGDDRGNVGGNLNRAGSNLIKGDVPGLGEAGRRDY